MNSRNAQGTEWTGVFAEDSYFGVKLPGVRNIVAFGIFVCSLWIVPPARSQLRDKVTVTFEIDRKAACGFAGFRAELSLNGRTIKPILTAHGFEVPAEFRKAGLKWKDGDKVDITLGCNNQDFVFAEVNPGLVAGGSWRFGMAYPVHALTQHGYSHGFEHGAWLAYIVFENNEPGIVVFNVEPDPPPGAVGSLLQEQSNATGVHARDVAYQLTVYQVDVVRNRDHLLDDLDRCLSRSSETTENDGCDRDLLKMIVNLYWRGEDSLLQPLLQLPNIESDVIDEMAVPYEDLLIRRGDEVLDALLKLPPDRSTFL